MRHLEPIERAHWRTDMNILILLTAAGFAGYTVGRAYG